MTVPTVSVCVISYNHARFVEQALRSVVEQRTSFPFEIVVADDCSPDGTRAIAERFARDASVPFRFLPRAENMGPVANVLDLFGAARGTYVAYLESDDYWVDPTRLATQVELLDSRPELSGCYGRAIVVDDSGNKLGDYFDYHKAGKPSSEVSQRMAVVHGSSAPSSTLVFRRKAIQNLPAWYLKVGNHQGLSVILTDYGPMAFVDRVWSTYRVHPGGVWSMQAEERKRTFDFEYAVALASDGALVSRYPKELGRRLTLTTLALARQRFREGKGVGSLLPMAQQLGSVATPAVLRAILVALPDLARLAPGLRATARR